MRENVVVCERCAEYIRAGESKYLHASDSEYVFAALGSFYSARHPCHWCGDTQPGERLDAIYIHH